MCGRWYASDVAMQRLILPSSVIISAGIPQTYGKHLRDPSNSIAGFGRLLKIFVRIVVRHILLRQCITLDPHYNERPPIQILVGHVL